MPQVLYKRAKLTADLLSVPWDPAFLLSTLQADQRVQSPHLVLPLGPLLQRPAHCEMQHWLVTFVIMLPP